MSRKVEKGWIFRIKGTAICWLALGASAFGANEIVYLSPPLTGSTLYGVAEIAFGETNSGNWWNGTAYATPTATRGDFDLPMADPHGVGQFRLSLPTDVAATGRMVRVYIFRQAGGSPSAAADGDPIAEFVGYWDGAKFATNVNGLAAGVISNATFATDALTANKIHADVTTELQAGLATDADLTEVEENIDAIKAVTDQLIALIRSIIEATQQ